MSQAEGSAPSSDGGSPAPAGWTAEEVAADVRAGRRTASAVLDEALSRIGELDGDLRSFVRLFDGARARAEAIDETVAEGRDPGPLAGVPIAIKDNIAVAGEQVTCGSRILESYRSPFHATVIERLLDAGAVLVGHTNMDEFGMGSSCENSAFFPTHNPWDLERVPGGSSGGSAAAVAARLVPLALGSDTGGSVRQPAALCGVTGLKPTYGRVSRYGLVAFGSSLDQIGPLATTVADAGICLEVMAGHDRRDATSSRATVSTMSSSDFTTFDPKGRRVGIVREFVDELPTAIRGNWETGLDTLRAAGFEIVDVRVPSARATVATYYVLATSEASANLARFDGIRYGRRAEANSLATLYSRSRTEGFGAEVKRRILLGTFSLSSGYYDAYYGKATAVAAQLKTELETALESCDVLATPTTPGPAFRIGELVDDPVAMYLSDVFTTVASLTGLPAIAVPSGLSAEGLPLSFQFIGRPFGEAEVLGTGRVLENSVGALRPSMVESRG